MFSNKFTSSKIGSIKKAIVFKGSYEEFPAGGFEEKSKAEDSCAINIEKHSFQCKTLATLKSRGTLIEGNKKLSIGQGNFSALLQGSESLLKPNTHKGSSDFAVSLLPIQDTEN